MKCCTKNNETEIEVKTEDSSDDCNHIHLRKSIGIMQGVGIIVGSIVGSGIFVSPVGILKYTNSVGMSFVMWLVCGLFSTLGAIVYAELGATIPKSGGEYIYILEAFGPLAAFVCLLITFLTFGAVGIAACGLIFAQYILQPFFPNCSIPDIPLKLITIAGLMFLAFINSYNVKWSTKLSIVFTVSKIFALSIVIGIGAYRLYLGRTDSFENAFDSSDISYNGLSLAYYQGFWAFSGWNYLNYLTGEMKNPGKTLPISITISLSLVTVIYIITNAAYLTVLSPVEMLELSKESVAVAIIFANKTMGSFAPLMSIFVSASVFGSINGGYLSVSRLIYAGAKEGHFPTVLSMVSYKYLTPMPAVFFLFMTSLALIFPSDIFYLIDLSGFAFCVISGMAVICLIYLRIKRPDWPRPFKLPLFIPIIFLLVDIFIFVITIYQSPHASLLSIILMLCGIPLYFIFIVWTSKPKSFLKITETLTIFVQKSLMVTAVDH